MRKTCLYSVRSYSVTTSMFGLCCESGSVESMIPFPYALDRLYHHDNRLHFSIRRSTKNQHELTLLSASCVVYRLSPNWHSAFSQSFTFFNVHMKMHVSCRYRCEREKKILTCVCECFYLSISMRPTSSNKKYTLY